MVYFSDIKKTKHYRLYHEKQVPWYEVNKVIFQSQKIIRKKGNKLEIENECYYILCKLKNSVLYVINAKTK